MSHVYPIARTAREALYHADHAARTRHEAEIKAANTGITALKTGWVSVSGDDLPRLREQISRNPGHGFVQNYEDTAGNIVLAIIYWQLDTHQVQPESPGYAVVPPDHTDDLYFRFGPDARPESASSAFQQPDLFVSPNRRRQ